MKQELSEKPQNLHSCALLLCLCILVGCAGCGQKTATPPENAPHRAPVSERVSTPTAPQTDAETPTPATADPILDADWQPIQLPPDYNPHYGRSYYGITENNQKPPPPDQFYSDPLFWIPGWAIRSEPYADGHGDSYLVLPNGEEKWARYKERRKALNKELGRPLTQAERYRLIAVVKSEGLSNLYAAKYLGKGNNPHAVEFAQKAHEENPDDFHTLFLLAHLQSVHPNQETYEPLAAANFRRLIAMNPNVARLHYEYARTTRGRERIRHYEKSFLLDPTLFYGDVLRSLALMHFVRAPEKSLRYLKIRNTLFPNEGTQKRIEILEQTGEWLWHYHK